MGVLLKVTHKLEEIPSHNSHEMALFGRSNAGKSTFINKIMGSKIAMVSSSPGKTQTFNLYQHQNLYYMDLPGIGYACVSHNIMKNLQERILNYLNKRKELSLIIHCMDIRHPWLKWDEFLYNIYTSKKVKCVYVLTKADKITKRQVALSLDKAKNIHPGIYFISNKNTTGGEIISFLSKQLDDNVVLSIK